MKHFTGTLLTILKTKQTVEKLLFNEQKFKECLSEMRKEKIEKTS
jgi:hypothetical protein